MLEWRLKAFNRLKALKEPNWQNLNIQKIDYQDLYYFSAPKSMKENQKFRCEVDPKLIDTYNKLEPLNEQKRLSGVAVDAVFDSVSVATTFKGELIKKGIIFCPISEAIQKHPDLVKNILDQLFQLLIIILQHSTQQCLLMALLFTYCQIQDAQWSFHIL